MKSAVLSVIALLIAASMLLCAGASLAAAAAKARYPQIELYTAPGCKSCKAASDYLTVNEIPFTAKDVSANEAFLEEMSERYRCSAVPLIVIGDGKKVLRGFVPEAFQLALRDVLVRERQQK